MTEHRPVKTGALHGKPGFRRSERLVYEAPVRIWHWVNAVAVLVLIVSGYLIASPLPSSAAKRAPIT